MPLWKMEQIEPYSDNEGENTTFNPTGEKLVKDCLTNSEIGIIKFIKPGHSYGIIKNGKSQKEVMTAPTIIAHTIVSGSPVYREEDPDMNSYEKAAKALYGVYWRNVSLWGKMHRVCYKWSLPTIAGSLVGSLILLLFEAITFSTCPPNPS